MASDRIQHQAGEALFRLGRSFGRLSLVGSADDSASIERSSVQVALAIDAGTTTGERTTVGWVADWLGVEASTASRLVHGAITAGLVDRDAVTGDRRQVSLRLTDAGGTLVRDAKRYQRQIFDELTATWDQTDRETFARLFLRFADEVMRRTAAERAADRRQ